MSSAQNHDRSTMQELSYRDLLDCLESLGALGLDRSRLELKPGSLENRLNCQSKRETDLFLPKINVDILFAVYCHLHLDCWFQV